MTDREVMKLALEALENSIDLVSHEARNAEELYGKYPTRLARIQGLVALEVAHEKAITALRSQLEQPEQQPVAIYQYQIANGSWIDQEKDSHDYNVKLGQATVRVVYTRPQPAAWVGLTDEDIARAGNLKRMLPYAYARAIEKLLRSKNGGAA